MSGKEIFYLLVCIYFICLIYLSFNNLIVSNFFIETYGRTMQMNCICKNIMLPASRNSWHRRTHALFARILPWLLESAVLVRNGCLGSHQSYALFMDKKQPLLPLWLCIQRMFSSWSNSVKYVLWAFMWRLLFAFVIIGIFIQRIFKVSFIFNLVNFCLLVKISMH